MGRFLVCPPDFFGVKYDINPHMTGNIGKADRGISRGQWANLIQELRKHSDVVEVSPQPHLPDMVFTANAGLIRGEKPYQEAIVANFKHPERQPESEFFRNWFLEDGLTVHMLESSFEGAGDALWDTMNDHTLWMAYGFRTHADAAIEITRFWPDIQIISLELSNPDFYHLDTCFCPLPHGEILFYPLAFTPESQKKILRSGRRLIPLSLSDANSFAANAVAVDRTIFLNEASPALKESLGQYDYQVVEICLDEFMKAGGSAKCLTLAL